jgi:hypothetical protein
MADALAEQLDAFLEELAEQAEEQGVDLDELLAEMLAGKPYATAYTKLNPVRILMQDPDATEVRPYVAWQENGRQVKAGSPQIIVLRFRGGDDDDDAAKAKAKAKAAAKGDGPRPGEISSDDLKPKRKFFTPSRAWDVRHTEPVVCETCGKGIRRTGTETKAEMQARGGRRRAATWTHLDKADNGHKAVRLWVDPKAADADEAAPAA